MTLTYNVPDLHTQHLIYHHNYEQQVLLLLIYQVDSLNELYMMLYP